MNEIETCYVAIDAWTSFSDEDIFDVVWTEELGVDPAVRKRVLYAVLLFGLVGVISVTLKVEVLRQFNDVVGPKQRPAMYMAHAGLAATAMVVLSWLRGRTARGRLVGALLGVSIALGVLNVALLTGWGGSQAASRFVLISTELMRALIDAQLWIAALALFRTAVAKQVVPLLVAVGTTGELLGSAIQWGVHEAGLGQHGVYPAAIALMPVAILLTRHLMQGSEGVDDVAGSRQRLRADFRYLLRSPFLCLLLLVSILVTAIVTGFDYALNTVASRDPVQMPQYLARAELFVALLTLCLSLFFGRRLFRWLGSGQIHVYVGGGCLFIAAASISQGNHLAFITGAYVFGWVALNVLVLPAYQVLLRIVPERHADGVRMLIEAGFLLFGGVLASSATFLDTPANTAPGAPLAVSRTVFVALASLAALLAVGGGLLRRLYRRELLARLEPASMGGAGIALEELREAVAGSPGRCSALLGHENPGLRELGLELLRTCPPERLKRLCRRHFKSADPSIRSVAARAIPAGDSVDRWLPTLRAGLLDADPGVREEVGRALARLRLPKQPSPELVACLESALGAECVVVAESVDLALLAVRYGLLSREEVLTAAVLQLQSTDERSMLAAVALIGGLGSGGLATTAGHLVRVLDDERPSIRCAGLRALGRTADGASLRRVSDCLCDSDATVRCAAAKALLEIGPQQAGQAWIAQHLASVNSRQWLDLVGPLLRAQDPSATRLLADSAEARLKRCLRRYSVLLTLSEEALSESVITLREALLEEVRCIRAGAFELVSELYSLPTLRDLALVGRQIDDDVRDAAGEVLENVGDRRLAVPLAALVQLDLNSRQAGTSGEHGFDEQRVRELCDGIDPWTDRAVRWFLWQREHLLHSRAAGAPSLQRSELESVRRAASLRSTPLFEDLPTAQLRALVEAMTVQSMSPGQMLLRRGEAVDALYVVLDGQLAECDDVASEERETLGPAGMIGHLEVLSGQAHPTDVHVSEPTRLLKLERDSLYRLMGTSPTLSQALVVALARGLTQTPEPAFG